MTGDDGAVPEGVSANGLGGSEARRMLGIGSVSGIKDMGLGSGRTPRMCRVGLWSWLWTRMGVVMYPLFVGLPV